MAWAALALRFLIELCAFAGFAVAGAAVSPVLAVAAPLAAIVVWALFAAPKAKRRLEGAALVALKVAVFGGAAAALVVAGHALLGGALAAAGLVDLLVLRRVAPDDAIPA
jgi:hypothetical protein